MKNNCIKNFSFLPSDYDCMVSYLNEMLEQGWRLKWVKAGFAGFVKCEPNEHITYVVEPYPNTNVMTLRRMPKTWLNFYTGNSWYFLGKSRGNFIYFTNLEDPKAPSQTSSMGINHSKEKVLAAEMTRNAIFLGLFCFLVYSLLNSRKFMYAYVLTNTFQYLTIIALVLAVSAIAIILLYALETVRLQAGTFSTAPSGGLKRGMLYHIRNFSVILLALVFFVLETIDTPKVLLLMALPVAALLIGGAVILKIMNKHENDAEPIKKSMPYIYGFGAIMVILLMISMTGIQKTNTAAANAARTAAFEKADTLPLVRYKDFFSDECTPQVKENNSYLGKNFLFQEADAERRKIVFNNYTVMNSGFAADKIFNYLYEQAQLDYMGSFEETDASRWNALLGDGCTAYKIPNQEAYLIRNGNTILLTTLKQ